MNKTIKIILICAVVVLLTGTTAFAAVHFSNAQKEEETTSEIQVNTTQINTTTSTTEQTTNQDLFDKSILLDYYWENNIQSPHVYEFKDDNTVIEYDGRLADEKSSWYCSRTLKYLIDNDTLIIDFGDDDYSCIVKLKYITKSENLNWDSGLTFYDTINDNEYFFYETSFLQSDFPENAMYLLKGELKTDKENSDKEKQLNTISEDEAKELLLTVVGVENNEEIIYRYEEKITYDGNSYYAFRATQLVDTHNVTVGEYFVSCDGTKIYDGDAYGGEYNFADLIWEK